MAMSLKTRTPSAWEVLLVLLWESVICSTLILVNSIFISHYPYAVFSSGNWNKVGNGRDKHFSLSMAHSCDADGQLNIKSYKTHSHSMVQSSPNKRGIRNKRTYWLEGSVLWHKAWSKYEIWVKKETVKEVRPRFQKSRGKAHRGLIDISNAKCYDVCKGVARTKGRRGPLHLTPSQRGSGIFFSLEANGFFEHKRDSLYLPYTSDSKA